MTYRTYSEYLKHPVFRSVCEKVRDRSHGRCEADVIGLFGPEKCGEVAIDFHHVRYCKWGEFDVPENLVHVCRECHEIAHTCTGCGGVLKSDAIKSGRDVCFSCYQGRRANGTN